MSGLLYGTKRIAAHLNNNGLYRHHGWPSDGSYTAGADRLSVRQVGYMIQRGLLPVFKVGHIWATTPQALAEHFDKLARERGADCNGPSSAGGD